MKIAIHDSKDSFSERWITYCKSNSIEFKLVDCFSTNIIEHISDCNALMWHFSQNSPRAILFAKQLLYSVEASGKMVFPNFNTVWHFDDKVGQKYLFESIEAPIAPTWIFYNKQDALTWAKSANFPKIFKLRGGGGSQNVKMVITRSKANKIIRKAFRKGYLAYDAFGSMKERYRQYCLKRTGFRDLFEGAVRFVLPPPYARVRGREKGYVYFQEFIKDNDYDIRVIVIGDKAFAIKRMVRSNDFRASGSGMILYEKEHFSDETIRMSFQLAKKLKSQSAAFDFVYSGDKIYVLEISYGFAMEGYDPCTGYWEKNLTWHEGKFNPYGWMVENLINSVEVKIKDK
jgi:glutathione synthase/RimK-type ligase-like ATP-grasp enzyme